MPSRIRLREQGLAAHLYLDREPKSSARPLAVLCPGLPYEPTEEAVTPELVRRGFDVIQLQYRGTYDSDGQLSPESAVATVADFVNELSSGRVTDRKTGQHVTVRPELHLLFGHSFGSWVAARSLEHVSPETCVLVAPSFAYGADAVRVGIVADTSGQSDYLADALPLTFRMADRRRWERFFTNDAETEWRPADVGSDVSIWPVVGARDPSYDLRVLKDYVRACRKDLPGLRELQVVPGADHGLQSLLDDAGWQTLLETVGDGRR